MRLGPFSCVLRFLIVLMPQTVRSVQPPLEFIPAAYSPWVMRIIHWLLPFFLRVRVRPWLPAGISRIEVDGADRLVDLYQQFEAGKVRFLMAVRHVEVDDPLSGLYLCSRAVDRAAKKRGIKLKQPVHTHFLYERGMTIWAGKFVGWMLSRIGGTPIRRGRKPDWVGLKAARQLLVEGDMPLVVAPEGATNGHSERMGPLEPGVAQLGFWCAEDLAKAGRSESVFIVPIGIQYRYETHDWTRLEALLTRLGNQSGLSTPLSAKDRATADVEKRCYLRILRLGAHLIETMERFYSRCYHQKFETESGKEERESGLFTKELPSTTELALDPEAYTQRIHNLLDKALGVSEQFFNLPAKGNFVDRARRLEEASWNYIYREDLPALDKLSLLEKGLADWAAQESSLRELHMRIVESFLAVDGLYVREKPSFERCAETALLLSDMLARLGGDKLPARPRLGMRWVQLTVQPPIEIGSRLAKYQENRRAGREAVGTLTEELRVALEETIKR